nr:uncharacterized protein LOC109742915 isoform X3 [Aegilops tauschii subsp. strangulata]
MWRRLVPRVDAGDILGGRIDVVESVVASINEARGSEGWTGVRSLVTRTIWRLRIRPLHPWERRGMQRVWSSTTQKAPGLDVLGLATRLKRGMPTQAESLPLRLQCELVQTPRPALLLIRRSELALTQLKKHMSFTTYTPGRLALASGQAIAVKQSTRCGCAALMQVLRSDDKGWYICEHKTEHNHALLV